MGQSFLNYLRVATSPAGINFPVFTNLEPITPDNTSDVAAKRKDDSFLIKSVHKSDSVAYTVTRSCVSSMQLFSKHFFFRLP